MVRIIIDPSEIETKEYYGQDKCYPRTRNIVGLQNNTGNTTMTLVLHSLSRKGLLKQVEQTENLTISLNPLCKGQLRKGKSDTGLRFNKFEQNIRYDYLYTVPLYSVRNSQTTYARTLVHPIHTDSVSSLVPFTKTLFSLEPLVSLDFIPVSHYPSHVSGYKGLYSDLSLPPFLPSVEPPEVSGTNP